MVRYDYSCRSLGCVQPGQHSMPELPEVETTRRGIEPHILGKTIQSVVVRQPALRWPVSPALSRELPGHTFSRVGRRGKYLLLETDVGTLLIHLGMSGSLRIVPRDFSLGKHDHVDLVFDAETVLRYTDPRRFGCMLWIHSGVMQHPLLRDLGPEPLSVEFTGEHLKHESRHKKVAVKNFIMDSKVVVGVGNIYANEALFAAGLRPGRAAGRVTLDQYRVLVKKIQAVLRRSIEVGGTTLRDFTGGDGQPGYFKQSLKVYGRDGEACRRCGAKIRLARTGQRSTFYCGQCQR